MTIRFVLGFLIGALIGASFALAMAPQSGSATRQQLIEKVKERAGSQAA